MPTPDEQIPLSIEQIAEIEARLKAWIAHEIPHTQYPASWKEVNALCATVKQLRGQNEWQKSTIENLTVGLTGCAKQLTEARQKTPTLSTGLFCNGCGLIIEGWPNVFRCVTPGCGRIYHEQCLLAHCAQDISDLQSQLEQLRSENKRLKTFVSMIARMTKDGEGGFEANAIDSFKTLEWLITKAREPEKL